MYYLFQQWLGDFRCIFLSGIIQFELAKGSSELIAVIRSLVHTERRASEFRKPRSRCRGGRSRWTSGTWNEYIKRFISATDRSVGYRKILTIHQ